MDRLREVEAELLKVFRSSATKHEANARAKPVLEQLTRDPSFLTAVIAKYLATPGALEKTNYPVVGMQIVLNPWFSLVANCWIPLPDRTTDHTTKAIHHHGTMLLSTATLFGPGYEHWMFSMPKAVTVGSDVYAMDLLEAAPHPQHHVSFVDAWTAHTPLYPKALSITLALWSNSLPTSWKDRVKRLPIFVGRENQLRGLAVKLGLKKGLDLKVVDSFDFYPEADGFKVTRERREFAPGPNEDHLASVFHVLQETGNEHLARTVPRGRPALDRLVGQIEKGMPIEGRLSPGHYGVPNMNFTRAEIEHALDVVRKGDPHGRKFTAEARSEASAGARSR